MWILGSRTMSRRECVHKVMVMTRIWVSQRYFRQKGSLPKIAPQNDLSCSADGGFVSSGSSNISIKWQRLAATASVTSGNIPIEFGKGRASKILWEDVENVDRSFVDFRPNSVEAIVIYMDPGLLWAQWDRLAWRLGGSCWPRVPS